MQNFSEIIIEYHLGTVVIELLAEALSARLAFVEFDHRTQQYRCRGKDYRLLLETLLKLKVSYKDKARAYEELSLTLREPITPRSHQSAALSAWIAAGGAATICLPTGAGKTILAVLAILTAKRSTLVIVPTIDLMAQWQAVLQRFLGIEVGLLGGGSHNPKPVTVATYDSAQIHIEHLGNKFGFIIFDECHHLPGPHYQLIALAAIAPFRLGLSATVKRSDGKEDMIYELVGPLVYEGDIHAMIGEGLAPFDIITCEIPLTAVEEAEYLAARQTYRHFIRQNNISMGSPQGWQQFIYKAAQSAWGREALKAHRTQKRLAQASSNKLTKLWEIIVEHRTEQMIVFTHDNEMAYRIGRTFFLPVLTHKTSTKERSRMLSAFRAGSLKILVTSKVLNEGVDVPDASIGVVVSGSSTVREHVQRLGRILRGKSGKRATMYELISAGTSETYVNQRRKEHRAYERSTDI